MEASGEVPVSLSFIVLVVSCDEEMRLRFASGVSVYIGDYADDCINQLAVKHKIKSSLMLGKCECKL